MKYKCFFWLLISLMPLISSAQFVGGNADGNSLGANLAYCSAAPLPQLANIALGGNADGYSLGSNLSYCSPAPLPQLSNIALGGNADGYSLGSNLSYCSPSPLPQLSNIALGGNADGYSLGSNLSYCSPSPLPQLSNIALGGNADGYSMGSNLTYCIPTGISEMDLQTAGFRIVRVNPDELNQTTSLIFTSEKEGTYKISVYDVLGHLVIASNYDHVANGAHEVNLDFSSVKHAVYLITLSDGKTTIACKLVY